MQKELLIVDDQIGIQLLLQDILTGEGYQVTTVANGKEAIEKLTLKSYGLIMLDYRLPIIDGLGVLHKLQELKIKTPTIVMSGLIERMEDEVKAIPNVKHILAKPFNVEDIPLIVKQVIDAT